MLKQPTRKPPKLLKNTLRHYIEDRQNPLSPLVRCSSAFQRTISPMQNVQSKPPSPEKQALRPRTPILVDMELLKTQLLSHQKQFSSRVTSGKWIDEDNMKNIQQQVYHSLEQQFFGESDVQKIDLFRQSVASQQDQMKLTSKLDENFDPLFDYQIDNAVDCHQQYLLEKQLQLQNKEIPIDMFNIHLVSLDNIITKLQNDEADESLIFQLKQTQQYLINQNVNRSTQERANEAASNTLNKVNIKLQKKVQQLTDQNTFLTEELTENIRKQQNYLSEIKELISKEADSSKLISKCQAEQIYHQQQTQKYEELLKLQDEQMKQSFSTFKSTLQKLNVMTASHDALQRELSFVNNQMIIQQQVIHQIRSENFELKTNLQNQQLQIAEMQENNSLIQHAFQVERTKMFNQISDFEIKFSKIDMNLQELDTIPLMQAAAKLIHKLSQRNMQDLYDLGFDIKGIMGIGYLISRSYKNVNDASAFLSSLQEEQIYSEDKAIQTVISYRRNQSFRQQQVELNQQSQLVKRKEKRVLASPDSSEPSQVFSLENQIHQFDEQSYIKSLVDSLIECGTSPSVEFLTNQYLMELQEKIQLTEEQTQTFNYLILNIREQQQLIAIQKEFQQDIINFKIPQQKQPNRTQSLKSARQRKELTNIDQLKNGSQLSTKQLLPIVQFREVKSTKQLTKILNPSELDLKFEKQEPELMVTYQNLATQENETKELISVKSDNTYQEMLRLPIQVSLQMECSSDIRQLQCNASKYTGTSVMDQPQLQQQHLNSSIADLNLSEENSVQFDYDELVIEQFHQFQQAESNRYVINRAISSDKIINQQQHNYRYVQRLQNKGNINEIGLNSIVLQFQVDAKQNQQYMKNKNILTNIYVSAQQLQQIQNQAQIYRNGAIQTTVFNTTSHINYPIINSLEMQATQQLSTIAADQQIHQDFLYNADQSIASLRADIAGLDQKKLSIDNQLDDINSSLIKLGLTGYKQTLEIFDAKHKSIGYINNLGQYLPLSYKTEKIEPEQSNINENALQNDQSYDQKLLLSKIENNLERQIQKITNKNRLLSEQKCSNIINTSIVDGLQIEVETKTVQLDQIELLEKSVLTPKREQNNQLVDESQQKTYLPVLYTSKSPFIDSKIILYPIYFKQQLVINKTQFCQIFQPEAFRVPSKDTVLDLKFKFKDNKCSPYQLTQTTCDGQFVSNTIRLYEFLKSNTTQSHTLVIKSQIPNINEEINYIRIDVMSFSNQKSQFLANLQQKFQFQFSYIEINNYMYLKLPIQSRLKPITWILKTINMIMHFRLCQRQKSIVQIETHKMAEEQEFQHDSGLINEYEYLNFGQMIMFFAVQKYQNPGLALQLIVDILSNVLFYQFDSQYLYFISRFIFEDIAPDYYLLMIEAMKQVNYQLIFNKQWNEPLDMIEKLQDTTLSSEIIPQLVSAILPNLDENRRFALVQNICSNTQLSFMNHFLPKLLSSYSSLRKICYQNFMVIAKYLASKQNQSQLLNIAAFRQLLELASITMQKQQENSIFYAYSGPHQTSSFNINQSFLQLDALERFFLVFELGRFVRFSDTTLRGYIGDKIRFKAAQLNICVESVAVIVKLIGKLGFVDGVQRARKHLALASSNLAGYDVKLGYSEIEKSLQILVSLLIEMNSNTDLIFLRSTITALENLLKY